MSQQWYYAVGGQQHGPITEEEIKNLAESGRLHPIDLVWKEGMPKWANASRVTGLFPELTANEPPPLPITATASAPAIPPIPAATVSDSSNQHGAAPPLWNPFAARAWSLLFTPVFGAFLHAQNWRALGEVGRAERSMIWVYAFIGLIVVAIFTPDAATPGIRLIGLGGLIAWALLDAEQQVRFVKQRFGKDYPRKSWVKPLAIGVGGWVALIVAGIIESAIGFGGFAEHTNVTLVKTGHMSSYPNASVGKAVDAFLSNPRWEAVHGTDGNEYVNVRGGAQYQNQPVRLTIQFRVDPKAGTFEVNALEMNDLPQNNLMKAAWMSKMFEDYNP